MTTPRLRLRLALAGACTALALVASPASALPVAIDETAPLTCTSQELAVTVEATLRVTGTLPDRIEVGQQLGLSDGHLTLSLSAGAVDELRARGYRTAGAWVFSFYLAVPGTEASEMNLASTNLLLPAAELVGGTPATVETPLPDRTSMVTAGSGTAIGVALTGAGAGWTLTSSDGTVAGRDASWGCSIGGRPLALHAVEVVAPTPIVGRVTPAALSRVWGGFVRVDGDRLSGARSVRVGNRVAAPFLLLGNEQLIAYLPPMPRGTYPLTVSSNGGTSQAVPITFR